MGILSNPHEVGPGNAAPVDRDGRCPCCGWPVRWKAHPADPTKVKLCGDCTEHVELPGEPTERTVDRYRVHAYVAQKLAGEAAAGAASAEAALAQIKAADKAARAQRAPLHEELDRWRALAMAAAAEHLPAPTGRSCSCGKVSPCPTERAMREADPRQAGFAFDAAARGRG